MTPTAYDAIGGHDTIVTLVDGLYDRLTHDPAVRHHFDPDRLDTLKAAQVAWFTACLRGEQPATDLGRAHAHLDITDTQVGVVLAHLDDLLAGLGVDRRLRRAVMALVTRLWTARQF